MWLLSFLTDAVINVMARISQEVEKNICRSTRTYYVYIIVREIVNKNKIKICYINIILWTYTRLYVLSRNTVLKPKKHFFDSPAFQNTIYKRNTIFTDKLLTHKWFRV